MSRYKNPLVSEEAFQRFATPHAEQADLFDGSGYGYGTGVNSRDGHRRLAHSGGMNGLYGYLVADLTDGLAVVLMALLLLWPAPGEPSTVPVADAGLSRYVAHDPITLDGTGSYDPDGDPIIDYHWYLVSGPAVEISDADTAEPVISGWVQARIVQTVAIGLVVSDGQLTSAADTVEVIIVPTMTHETLSLLNGPFRPDLPTLISFGGGNCVDGIPMRLNATWQERFNIITGPYFYPYADHAFQVIVLLSTLAPDYRQPIQVIGFSTGGNPATKVANIVNPYFRDPRYAINRMTLLDTYCDDDLDQEVDRFTKYPVAGEPAWVDVYRSLPEPIPGALNMSFFPGGDHGTPADWFVESAEADSWPGGDMYNQGVTGGYFLSVGGPGRNLQLASEGLYYYFECPELAVGCLQQTDPGLYPGLVPEPVHLIGPEDGAEVDWRGVVLTCEESRHATSYELLFGPDPANMTAVISATPHPPDAVIAVFPFTPTYWTVRARDAFGTTIFASPRAVFGYESGPVRRAAGRVGQGP